MNRQRIAALIVAVAALHANVVFCGEQQPARRDTQVRVALNYLLYLPPD